MLRGTALLCAIAALTATSSCATPRDSDATRIIDAVDGLDESYGERLALIPIRPGMGTTTFESDPSLTGTFTVIFNCLGQFDVTISEGGQDLSPRGECRDGQLVMGGEAGEDGSVDVTITADEDALWVVTVIDGGVNG